MLLTFVDTHNMVVYLNKSDASKGFNQLIYFLNASYIKYALTINPHIYVSCIKQFWDTVVVKQSNDVKRLHALVDKKKVMITEAKIRDALRLDNAEGVDCLPNEEIFAELARMGYEKPSTKLTFYKAFFSSHWKFLKVFTNMRRVGKGFSGAETPLFEGMLVGVVEEQGDAEEQVQDDVHETSILSPTPPPQQSQDLPSISQHLEYDKVAQALEIKKLKRRVKKLKRGNRVKVLKLRRLQKVRTSQRIDISEDTMMEDASNQGRMIDDLDKDDVFDLMDDKGEEKKEEEEDEPAKVQEVVDVVTTAKLITEVVTAAIRVVASTRRRKGVIIRDPKEESTTIIHADTKSKDKGKRIMVEEPKPLKKKQQNVAGFKLDYFKGMSYDDIRPIFKAKFNSNIAFLLKSKERLEEEENRAIESINETPTQKATKRRELNEEVEDFKRHLEIMPDKDDDVYTKTTPLARKVPVVDYEIIHLNNKPHYKIIRADGTHQLYVSFLTLLKNIDREDLESLWSLDKERFSTSKPKNFSDDFLLTTLGAMFERLDGQAQVWKSQRTVHGQAKFKS
nr:hypothetical protein [Tanacetum cinerariifolium]